MATRMMRAGRGWVGVMVLLAALLSGVMPAAAVQTQRRISIEVLSNRADLISGGDALIEIWVAGGGDQIAVRVLAGDDDVTASFVAVGDGRLRGLVSGLPEGDSEVVAILPDGSGARITLTNHPTTGPIFSGAHGPLWFCNTEDQGLGPSEPLSCEAPTVVELFYRTTAGLWATYDPTSPPTDITETTTDEGKTVPFIVRQEIGTMNRGIYTFAVLWDPERREPSWQSRGAFNGKYVAAFGPGAGLSPRQGTIGTITTNDAGPADFDGSGGSNSPELLGRGFVVGGHSLNRGDINMQGVVQAESLMMLKERIIEVIGPLRYTMGIGGSGGSVNQNNITAAYPGLLDGVILGANFMELFTNSMQNTDWKLLYNHFLVDPDALQGDDGSLDVLRRLTSPLYTPAQIAAVTGDPAFTGSIVNANLYWIDPEQDACDAAWAYRAETNPYGYRCTLQDLHVNVLGQRPPDRWTPIEQQIGRGFAPRVYDNVGVQYGLQALLDNAITAEHFVNLNESIGGYDIDFRWTAQRSVADPEALEIAYRTGRIPVGTSWGNLPVIDLGGDGLVELVHPNVRALTFQARLRAAHGSLDTYSMRAGVSYRIAADQMDRWLSAIEADERDVPARQKVVDNRPVDAGDSEYGDYQSARMAAGGPPTDDVQKCQLKTLDPRDYEGVAPPMTDAQLDRLREAFPDGVCDWTRPGVAHQPNVAWVTFTDGPGGRPLGPPPVSQAFGPTAAAPEEPAPPAPAAPAAGPASLPRAADVRIPLPATGDGAASAALLLLAAGVVTTMVRAGASRCGGGLSPTSSRRRER
jgi:hypothetical protein